MEPERFMDSGTMDKVYIRNSDVVSRKIADELFLVPIRGKIADMDDIFALAGVAEYVWGSLDGRRSLNEILHIVVERFDVEYEQAESDIREFIMELLRAGLITEESL